MDPTAEDYTEQILTGKIIPVNEDKDFDVNDVEVIETTGSNDEGVISSGINNTVLSAIYDEGIKLVNTELVVIIVADSMIKGN